MPRLDTLWYEIDARTKDFDENIVGAKAKLRDFTDYAGKHPGIVLGALGVAFAAVAYEATKMAAEIDEAMRHLKAAMPSVTGDIKSLREEIVALSLSTPRTQKELSEVAVEIAKLGVTGPEELKMRLRAVAELSEATSLDMRTVAEGLNTIGDAFQLSGKHAVDALKEIFATTQGKVPLEEVFSAMARGSSVLATLSVRATDAAQAMTTLRDAGVMPRKVGTALIATLEFAETATKQLPAEQDPVRRAELTKYLEIVTKTNIATNGLIPTIRQLSDAFGNEEASLRHLGLSADATNAVLKIHDKTVADTRTETEKLEAAEKAVAAAAYENSNSMQALSEKIHNNLNASLIELGTKILPIVNAAFQTMLDMMNSGSRDARELGDAIKRIQSGRPNEGPAAAGISRIFNYDLEKGQSAAETDVERVARAAQMKGVGAVFGEMTSEQMEAQLRYLRTLKTEEDDRRFGVKETVADLTTLITVTRAHEAALDKMSEKERADTIAAAKHTDEIRKQGLAREENLRIAKETGDKIIALGEELQKAVAGETHSKVDDKIAAIAAIEAKIEAIQAKGGVIPQKDIDNLIKLLGQIDTVRTQEAVAAQNKFNELMGTTTTSVVDNLTSALETLKTELSVMPGFTADMIKQVVDAKQAVIDANKQILAGPALGEANVDDRSSAMSQMRGFVMERQRLMELEERSLPNSAARAAYTQRIKDLTAQITKLQEGNKLLEADILEIEKKRLEHLSAAIQTIQGAVTGALQLAEAFGLVNSNTVQVIQSLSNIGSMLPSLVKAMDAFHAGTGGIMGVVGAGLPVVGALASVFGGIMGAENALAAEHNRLVKENTLSLNKLSENIGDLARISVTGTEYQRVAEFLKNPSLANIGTGLQGIAGFGQDAQNRAIGAILDAMHMTAQELKDFAKQFGVTVGTGTGGKILADDLKQLAEAMKNAEITKFADTFSGQMAQMDASIKLFDLTKPIDQFKQLQKALDSIKGGGGALSSILKGFDLTTSAGVAAAEKALQEQFDKMQAGSITGADLGGLTPQEYLDTLLKTMDILRAQGASPGLGGTGGFNVSQTITQVTGERMSALLSTANTWAEMTARNTGQIVAAMGGVASLPSIAPPLMSTTAGFGGAGGIVIQSMPINVVLGAGLVDTDTAQKIGTRIGTAAVDAIDKELATRLRWQRRGRGLSSGI